MEKGLLNADYQRIKKVMEYLNFSSDKKFAEAVGLSPQNLYDIKAGKKGITPFVTDKITERYDQFSKSYLMLGDGDMINGAQAQNPVGHIHIDTNASDEKYLAHLEAEIEMLRKEKEELWALVQKLMK